MKKHYPVEKLEKYEEDENRISTEQLKMKLEYLIFYCIRKLKDKRTNLENENDILDNKINDLRHIIDRISLEID